MSAKAIITVLATLLFSVALSSADNARKLESLGTASLNSFDYGHAISYYQAAFKQAQSEGDTKAQCDILNKIGYAYYLMKDHVNASQYMSEALRFSVRTGYKDGEMQSYLNLAMVLMRAGNSSQSLDYSQNALNLAKELKSRDAELKAMFNICAVQISIGKYTKGLELLKEALQKGMEYKDEDFRIPCIH